MGAQEGCEAGVGATGVQNAHLQLQRPRFCQLLGFLDDTEISKLLASPAPQPCLDTPTPRVTAGEPGRCFTPNTYLGFSPVSIF